MFKFRYLARLLRTWLELGDTLTNALHCSSTLVTQDDGEKPLGVTAAQSVGIRVTHPGGKQLRGRESVHYRLDTAAARKKSVLTSTLFLSPDVKLKHPWDCRF